jgi:transposase
VRPAGAGRQGRPHAPAADPAAGHLQVGALTAAKLLGETHSVDRFASAAAFAAHTGTAPIPVSSGNAQRHRLSRSGNRQLNRALFTIAMCQARWDPNARAYLAASAAKARARPRRAGA